MNKLWLVIGGAAWCFLAVGAAMLYFRPKPPLPLAKAPEHGTSCILEIDPSAATGGTNVLTKTKDAIQKRFVKLGWSVSAEQVSETRIRIAIPTIAGKGTNIFGQALSQEGRLEFRLVHSNSKDLVQDGIVPIGYELLEGKDALSDAGKQSEKLLVARKTQSDLAPGAIKATGLTRDNLGRPQIMFTLNDRATEAFAKLTRENTGQRLAIVIDGQLYSAPVISSPIEGGIGVIAGNFNEGEAFRVAAIMEHPLPVPVNVIELKTY